MTTESTPLPGTTIPHLGLRGAATRTAPLDAPGSDSPPSAPSAPSAPSPPSESDVPDPVDPRLITSPVGTVSRRLAAGFIAGYFGIWVMGFGPIIILYPLKAGLLSPGNKAGTLSLVLGVSAIFGILATPVAGRLSDRATSRFGRRRPWLMFYVVLGLVGLVVDASAPDVGVFLTGVCLGAVAFAGSIAVILAVLPEHVPASRRGAISGLLGVAQSVAVIVGVGLTAALSQKSLFAAFVVLGVLGVVLMAVFCLVLPDRPLPRASRPPFGVHELLDSFWVSPRSNPGFAWAWASRFAIFMAFASVVNYQIFFLQDQLSIPASETAGLVGLGTGLEVAMVVVSSVVAGMLSDRSGRRKIFAVVAAGLGVVGLLLLATATSLTPYFIGLAVVGLGQGAYYAVDLALVSDLLPANRDNDARDLGVFSLANQVPQSLAPAIAPAFLAIGFGSVASTGGGNYTALFGVSAVFAVIGAVTISRVKGVR